MVFELFHAFTALIRDDDSAFANVQWHNPLSIDNLGELPLPGEGALQHLESICTILHGLARMNAR